MRRALAESRNREDLRAGAAAFARARWSWRTCTDAYAGCFARLVSDGGLTVGRSAAGNGRDDLDHVTVHKAALLCLMQHELVVDGEVEHRVVELFAQAGNPLVECVDQGRDRVDRLRDDERIGSIIRSVPGSRTVIMAVLPVRSPCSTTRGRRSW